MRREHEDPRRGHGDQDLDAEALLRQRVGIAQGFGPIEQQHEGRRAAQRADDEPA
jgi:hypothetical protein